MPSALERLKVRARVIKRETYALYLACRDPRTPWYARLFAGAVVAYALSPLDLIPDFVPVLGYLDDVVLVPLGIVLAMKMIPGTVLAECRTAAAARTDGPASARAAAVIVAIWVLAAVLVGWLVVQTLT